MHTFSRVGSVYGYAPSPDNTSCSPTIFPLRNDTIFSSPWRGLIVVFIFKFDARQHPQRALGCVPDGHLFFLMMVSIMSISNHQLAIAFLLAYLGGNTTHILRVKTAP